MSESRVDRRHRTWSQLTLWEKGVRAYLVLQVGVLVAGAVFTTSGYRIASPTEGTAALAVRIDANAARIAAIETHQVTTDALIGAGARYLCQQSRSRAELAGFPCGRLLGNRMAEP